MADVSIEIGGRSYPLSCRDGDEPQLRMLARMIDERVTKVKAGTPGITETRQFLFAALLLADELNDLASGRKGGAPAPSSPPPESARDATATREVLEALAERLENAAERLAAVATAP